jgi:DNA-binding transcriptional LysR family regulator
MDMRRLEVFCKLMETRSFSRTAEEISLRQPTVSGHIKSLEDLIGVRLFDRHGREVIPTSAADLLYTYARQILRLRTEARYALERYQGRVGGELKLGGSTIPGGYILPTIMGRFHTKYTDAYVSLVIDDTQGIVDRVLAGKIEVGVVGARIAQDYLQYEPLMKDEMILVTPMNHPWAETGILVKIENLRRAAFIMREQGSGTRSTMLEALSEQGLTINDLEVVAEMGSTEAVRQAVKAGLGVSILSRRAVEDELRFNLIKHIKVPGLNLTRTFFLVTHRSRTRSPLGQAFIEFLEEESKNRQGV